MTEKLTAADLDEIEKAAAVAHPAWRGDLERLISALRDAWDASSAKSAALKAYIAENRSLLAKLAAAEKVCNELRRFREDWYVTPTPAMEALSAFDSLNGGTT